MSGLPGYESLYSFLCAEFAEADWEGLSDEAVLLNCLAPQLQPWHRTVIAEGRAVLAAQPFPWEAIAHYANRHFETEAAARAWLTQILDGLEQHLSLNP
ncbi:hypothetical protein [Spirulina major]|uniref:hypothetical protein n=1 Tax=Spirulina major TaxID=270636 RepID=UPI000934D77A|nr:hypothetical protein [Spirulina major]